MLSKISLDSFRVEIIRKGWVTLEIIKDRLG